MMNRFLGGVSLSALMLRNAEGGGSGGGDGGAAEGAGEGDAPAGGAASILFPNEGKPEGDEGGDQKPEGDDKPKDEGDGGEGDWKEYQADPNKSDEENAAAKAEHDKTKPAEKKDGDDDIANKVPEDGKYALTMPDGIELDAELAEALGPEFKELGLTNGQAQKLVDKYIATQQARVGKQAQTWAATVDKWGADAKADPEMGGAKWEGTKANALRAIDRLGTPGLREYLQSSGGGNHPEVIRAFAKAGAMIREDDPAAGGAEGAGNPAIPAHRLFPNDVPKGK